jgi:hypothetical protein
LSILANSNTFIVKTVLVEVQRSFIHKQVGVT